MTVENWFKDEEVMDKTNLLKFKAICKFSYHNWLNIVSLSSNDQHFNQYQQNKQPPLTSSH
jgi:hypothetical protein